MTARAQAERVAVVESLDTGNPGQWRLDERLAGIDAVFRRLAKPESGVTLHALEKIRMLHDGAVLGMGQRMGLPPDQAALVDCLLSAPDYERGFVKVLYWLKGSNRWKVERLGIGHTKFNKARNEVLAYFRGQMHAKGFRV